MCHGAAEQETYRELRELIDQEVSELIASGKDLPPRPITQPMREAIDV